LGIWLRCVLEDRPFEVWGGSQLRDLTYADDVTEAFLLAADLARCHGQIFNVGGSPPASLREIADLMVRVAGPPSRYITREFPADRATIDIGSYYSDDRAFRNATGWEPTIGIEEGLMRTLEWYRPRVADYL
jgi:UDP-glucose 4-epimerase